MASFGIDTEMFLEIFIGLIFVLFAIYALLLFYVWFGEVIPYWKKNKHKYPVSFWSLGTTRELKRKAFLEGFSIDADKPWSYYIIKYMYVPVWIVILIAVFCYMVQ
jgi:hypothetical protein